MESAAIAKGKNVEQVVFIAIPSHATTPTNCLPHDVEG